MANDDNGLRNNVIADSLLNVAEGQPWTDGGWTKVGSKMNETRSGKVANNERQVTINGYQTMMAKDAIVTLNDMKINDRGREDDGEHGNMCYRKEQNQRLSWEIEHIDE